MFCMRAPHAVQPSLMSSFRARHPLYGPSELCPSPFSAEGPSFTCLRHTWLGRAAMRLRQLKLHGQNHSKCTQFGPCKKKVFNRPCFLKTEY